MQAAIALYKACGYEEVSQEATVDDVPGEGGSLLGEASDQPHSIKARGMHGKAFLYIARQVYHQLILSDHACRQGAIHDCANVRVMADGEERAQL